MITDYAIICDSSAHLLSIRVKAAIADGWQPHGELLVVREKFYQAMTMSDVRERLVRFNADSWVEE